MCERRNNTWITSIVTETVATMWLQLSTVTALCIILELVDASLDHDDALERIFTQRSKTDWEKVWHQETHSRCREKIVRHLIWACEKDIYRLSRRNSGVKVDESLSKRSGGNVYPWLPVEEAHQMIRFRRNIKPGGSITSECCTKIGCTWEEFAEYCPSNKRLNQYMAS